ncbi:MAG: hypothetical protein ACRET6_12320 [Burkholderiales bacterium]
MKTQAMPKQTSSFLTDVDTLREHAREEILAVEEEYADDLVDLLQDIDT